LLIEFWPVGKLAHGHIPPAQHRIFELPQSDRPFATRG
jgi:hypothetical protein